jgi:hypothetical protein
MFGIRIIREKEYQELKTKLNGLSSLEQVLEKQENHIKYVADSVFEGKYNELVINERVRLLNQIYEVKRESDFIKLTIVELLEVLQQTDIVKKDKRLVKVFNDAIVNVKKRLKILVEDKDIKKQV